MCRSVCENYFRACGYNEDMWRCGDYALLGAKEAEVPVQNKTQGSTTYTATECFQVYHTVT